MSDGPVGGDGHVEVDGLVLNARRWGVGRTGGPPVLLLHGLGGNTITWEAAAGPLADALDAEVLAVDLPGFGLSRTGGRRATIPAMADLVARLAERSGPVLLAGNSMGGAVGLRAARAHAGAVAGLVALNSPWPRHLPGALRGVDRDELRTLARFATVAVPGVGDRVFHAHMRQLGPQGAVDVPIAFLFHDRTTLDPELRDRMVAVSARRYAWGAEAAAAYTQASRSLWRWIFDPRAGAADVAGVRCPTLVVHGRSDRLVPPRLLAGARATRPDWTYVELDGAGHVPQLERPDAVLDAIVPWVNDRWRAGDTVPWRR